ALESAKSGAGVSADVDLPVACLRELVAASQQIVQLGSGRPSMAPAAVAVSSVGDEAMLQRLGLPTRVRIDAPRIDAPVHPVGLVDGNVLQVPQDIDWVGWYRFGPRPGSAAGSAVLVAHRDGTTQGRGVFLSLDALDVDSTVEVVTSAGFVLKYRVVSVEGIQKAQFQADIEEFFASDGPPRLTLITCGGAFDRDSGG
ncbi:MAG: class F sortase, partial [Actinomycetales bacterium]